MTAFTEFLEDVVQRGQLVNVVFEERLFDLAGVLRRITSALAADGIPHELIGGFAVLIYVEEANPEASALTRDVDLMVLRSDLERIKAAASVAGFRYRHAAGVDMLIPDSSDSTRYAVHLIFSGEKVRPDYALSTPPIAPRFKQILGHDVAVIPLPDLLIMKLTSYRLKDQVHIQSLDAAGLIVPEIEAALPGELRDRLHRIREAE